MFFNESIRFSLNRFDFHGICKFLIEQIENSLDDPGIELFGKNFNSCRLKLQVIIHDGVKFENYLTEPIYSHIIENSINKKI